MSGLFWIVFCLVFCWAASAQTVEELRARVNDRDRKITEQNERIERLTYAAGLGAAQSPSRTLTAKQHAETIAKVDEASQVLSSQVSQAALNAELAQAAAIRAAVAAAIANEKLDRAKAESSKSLIEAVMAQVVVFLTLIAGFIRSDLRERRNHRWALEADAARRESIRENKLDTDNKLATITALIDGTKQKTVDWKDIIE